MSNAEEPGAKRKATTLVLIESLEYSHEDFFREILSDLRVPTYPREEIAVESRSICLIELRKRRRVSILGALHNVVAHGGFLHIPAFSCAHGRGGESVHG